MSDNASVQGGLACPETLHYVDRLQGLEGLAALRKLAELLHIHHHHHDKNKGKGE